MDRLIEGIILSYHTPFYFKGYGQGESTNVSMKRFYNLNVYYAAYL